MFGPKKSAPIIKWLSKQRSFNYALANLFGVIWEQVAKSKRAAEKMSVANQDRRKETEGGLGHDCGCRKRAIGLEISGNRPAQWRQGKVGPYATKQEELPIKKMPLSLWQRATKKIWAEEREYISVIISRNFLGNLMSALEECYLPTFKWGKTMLKTILFLSGKNKSGESR